MRKKARGKRQEAKGKRQKAKGDLRHIDWFDGIGSRSRYGIGLLPPYAIKRSFRAYAIAKEHFVIDRCECDRKKTPCD
ncbi:MAG: hypothetical protein F6K63_11950 [Moorea sp. SIO1G6]|uniref:hypothetical protein n=1 Tax=Moorena sp. SIO1G6 TaxID=2607840 RepID=UPI0013BF0D93|nr:hypothetical protein [Moorena sp. SIO1G6]NET65054.1 hypothetical protein [Moorena sp. SIO1G6]